MNIKETCDKVKRMVDKAITWESDENTIGQIEHWQSHAQRILDNEDYHTLDDCDGFTLTSAELLVHYQIERSLIRIVFCEMPEYGGHLVCTVDDTENNETWVLDNNEPRVAKWGHLNYRWISYMSYDNLGNWIKFPD